MNCRFWTWDMLRHTREQPTLRDLKVGVWSCLSKISCNKIRFFFLTFFLSGPSTHSACTTQLSQCCLPLLPDAIMIIYLIIMMRCSLKSARCGRSQRVCTSGMEMKEVSFTEEYVALLDPHEDGVASSIIFLKDGSETKKMFTSLTIWIYHLSSQLVLLFIYTPGQD